MRRLTEAKEGTHTLTYVYDALSRLLSETGPLGAVFYQYDPAGRRTRIDYPGPNNFHLTYDYHVTGEPTRVRENGAGSGIGVLSAYSYDGQMGPTPI